MALKINIRFPKFPKGMPRTRARKRMMEAYALESIDVMQERNARGVGLDGNEYDRPYSKSWEKFKVAKGRTPYQDGDWHIYTGLMMGSQTVLEHSAKHFIVGFTGSRPPIDQRLGKKKSKTKKGRMKKRGAGKTQKKSRNKMVNNALIAYVNNKIRPFVGLNQKERRATLRNVMRHAKERKWI